MRRIKRILSSVVVASMLIVSVVSFGAKKVNADGFNPGVEAFVRSLYSDCLGRDADPSGLNDWCTRLTDGSVTGKECAFGFFFSSEFQSKANQMSDSDLINAYYKVFLGRGADSAGSSYWAGQIANTTNDLGILFTGFADSAEFSNKCETCGITAGSHIDVPATVRSYSSPAPASAPAATPASTTSSSSSSGGFNPPAGNDVWVCENGSRYHTRSSCSGMVDPRHVSLEWAQANGYTPCRRSGCYG